MNKLGLLGVAMMMGSMATPFNSGNSTTLSDVTGTPKEPPMPKGCKRYIFNQYGENITGNGDAFEEAEWVFECNALNERSAIRKFNNYKEKHYGDNN